MFRAFTRVLLGFLFTPLIVFWMGLSRVLGRPWGFLKGTAK